MRHSVDRALVQRLLEETDLSRRAIATEAQCSDWSVRKIERELAGGNRPMKRARSEGDDGPAGSGGWLVLVAFIAILSGVIWAASRGRLAREVISRATETA